MTDPELRLFPICEPCVRGEGKECHTPGCSLWMHDVPPNGLSSEMTGGEAVPALLAEVDRLTAERDMFQEKVAGLAKVYRSFNLALGGLYHGLRSLIEDEDGEPVAEQVPATELRRLLEAVDNPPERRSVSLAQVEAVLSEHRIAEYHSGDGVSESLERSVGCTCDPALRLWSWRESRTPPEGDAWDAWRDHLTAAIVAALSLDVEAGDPQ